MFVVFVFVYLYLKVKKSMLKNKCGWRIYPQNTCKSVNTASSLPCAF